MAVTPPLAVWHLNSYDAGELALVSRETLTHAPLYWIFPPKMGQNHRIMPFSRRRSPIQGS